jgi:ketosteroid isomerase-like protein
VSDSRSAVLAANDELYAAVETGDLDRLRRLCSERQELVCVHPAAEPIHGTAAVLRSWALIMANTDYIQFFLTDVEVTVSAELAVVTCSENVLTGRPDQTASFQGGRARGLNVFTREADSWRLWIHQASPVGSDTS